MPLPFGKKQYRDLSPKVGSFRSEVERFQLSIGEFTEEHADEIRRNKFASMIGARAPTPKKKAQAIPN